MVSKKKDIKLLFRHGKRLQSPLFSVWMGRREERVQPLLLAVCSRKVDKRATRRNLLKRRTREILRRDISPKFSGRHVMVEIHPLTARLPFKEFREKLLHVFHL